MAGENAKRDINGFPTLIGVDASGNVKIIKANSHGSLNMGIVDSAGRELLLESNNAAPVNIQDQHSEAIDLYFCRNILTTAPSSAILLDARSITLDSVTGASVGDCIDIMENGRTFQAIVQSVNADTKVVVFSAPADQAFTTAAVVCIGKWNMNVDGSSSALIYAVGPPAGAQWDINRIIVGMSDDVVMDDAKFGGITALTNGLVMRVKNGYTKNLFIVSDNGGWRERSFDVAYADKAPAGTYGFGCRKTFNGQDKSGVSIRLDGDSGDQIQVLIQDNLTGLIKLAIVAQGHKVAS